MTKSEEQERERRKAEELSEKQKRAEAQVIITKIVFMSFENWEAEKKSKAAWCFEQAKEAIRDIQADACSGRAPSDVLLMRLNRIERELRCPPSQR